ncbi:hypothetical protein XU18_1305 [Perkinsela sp. CCAP 1560/4]|nr:hypothetical protein XU18_1305 [Perkinsela sp. CCAP 1560/4]|eukprot:KNH08139.1 hypothetical protein XU18_1305 [Perkinsela sp. CCAP 1560/4]
MSWQGGSSIFHTRTKGRLHSGAHRKRMPWTAVQERFPSFVLNTRNRTILDGHDLPAGIERAVQKDPLDILKYIVARHDYDRSTGQTLIQLALQQKFKGRGQRFYRREWQEGTYDKYVTLCHVQPTPRDSKLGQAFGYITFHGESSLRPMQIWGSDTPGWHVDYDESRAVPDDRVVPAPVSIGTEVPVDPKKYRLKAYPNYEPPNPSEFVHRLLQERGILPSVLPEKANAPAGQPNTAPNGDDSSVEYTPSG